MSFGVTDKIYHDEYLANHVCQDCGKAHDTKLIIYCRAFVTGPVTWWAWGKRGYLECKSCGALSNIHPSLKEFKEARHIYSRKSTPLRYFVPSIVFGGLSAIVIVLFLIGFMAYAFISPKQKLTGIWVSSNGLSYMYFFKDNQYTLIDDDTILFGNYTIDGRSGRVSIPITGKDNTVNDVDMNRLTLDYEHYYSVNFSKIGTTVKGENPYEKRFNTWRIRATHNESKAELKQRVMDYLYYLQLRYKWAIANQLNTLPPDLYSPVLQGQNGIGVYEKSVPLWRDVFYSEENWMTASRFLYQSFPKNNHIDPKEKNVFKRNLKAIDAYIESAKKVPIY